MKSAAVKTLSGPVKPTFAALVFVLASAAFAPEASALPGIDRALPAQAGQNIEKTRWVCGPYQCWWQPGYGYGWGGRRWGGGWGRPYWGPRYGWGGGWGHGHW